MAFSYLPVDREQQFLLPPDVRDWLPADHLAWFVVDVVERVDTSVWHAAHPNVGVGRRAYDPDMLLALLVYAYCTGQRSSRRIERLCEVDVAYRVICANHVPDHTTIARFRQVHEAGAVGVFTDVLELCAAAGLAGVGVVAVDGTKMAGDASGKVNRTRAQIEAEVRSMLGEAAAVDADEDRRFGAARGDELPAELADPRSRRARLDAALAELAARKEPKGQAAQARRQARRPDLLAAAAEQGLSQGGRLPGGEAGIAEGRARLEVSLAADAERLAAWEVRVPKSRKPGESIKTRRLRNALARVERSAASRSPHDARVNTTDPDSRIMVSPRGWVQGFNAQAAVNEGGLILAADVTQDAGDVHQCQPMMAATRASLDAAGVEAPIGIMLFDAGYCSTDNLTAPGPDRLIATTKSYKLRRQARTLGWAADDPPGDANPTQAMEHRLRTETGAALYKKRQHTVEPVFGNIKHGRGFRSFTRRGLAATKAEWQLIAATHNILKLHRHNPALA